MKTGLAATMDMDKLTATLYCLIGVGGKFMWVGISVAHVTFWVLTLVIIILDEFCVVIRNTSSMYVRFLCGAPLDKNQVLAQTQFGHIL
jgi:hypothetical protein